VTSNNAPREDLGADHLLLLEAVREAGALALRYFRTDVDAWDKSPDNPVSEADLAVDRLLREQLTGARPDFGWLSEETEDGPDRRTKSHVWIVDPIDGTRAFLRGDAQFAVSVALVVDGHPVLGAVFNPATDELFEAVKSGGARLNGTPIAVSTCADPVRARMLASKRTFRNHDWPAVADGAEFHFVNSMAYRMAVVADGRYDATITMTNKSEWDIAAAHLIVEEAGGCVTRVDGSPITYNREHVHHDNVIAACRTLHDVLVTGLLPKKGSSRPE
jgi:myo-inositol-1(or 4)-monophosphatase